jgi:hypothetical protein
MKQSKKIRRNCNFKLRKMLRNIDPNEIDLTPLSGTSFRTFSAGKKPHLAFAHVGSTRSEYSETYLEF